MLFHFQQRITRFLDHRSTSHEQRLCLIVYLVGTLMCALGMPLHFSGIIGIHSPWLLVLSGIAWVICLVLLALYLVHRLSLKWAISGSADISGWYDGKKRLLISCILSSFASWNQ